MQYVHVTYSIYLYILVQILLHVGWLGEPLTDKEEYFIAFTCAATSLSLQKCE